MTPNQIRSIRRALALTQEQFAERIGAQRPTVARWETGVNKPQGANLKALKELAEKAKEVNARTVPVSKEMREYFKRRGLELGHCPQCKESFEDLSSKELLKRHAECTVKWTNRWSIKPG
jgi:transcriptional regulator with XRE-family HTH domain